MRLFEYVFYRIAKFYFKRDGSSAFRTICIISFSQGALLADFFLIVRLLFLQQSDLAGYVKYSRTIGIVLALMLMGVNYLFFKNKYWKLSDRWREAESKDPTLRKGRGLLVIAITILPFVLFFLIFMYGKHIIPRISLSF